MKKIPLTQGKFAIVDDEDYEYLSQFKWYASKDGKNYYAQRSEMGVSGKKTISMHRVVAKAPSNLDVDHKDGNGLNNQRENLRTCTRSQNSMNRKKTSNRSSAYKGVSWHKQKKKFGAYIQVENKVRCLGYFVDEIVAAKIYDSAAKIYYGKFARTNF